MSRLILLGVLCAWQISFALPQLAGINYEYDTPHPLSETELFTALLESTSGTNVTLQQFMYHFKHGLYASAFLTEFFTLGINTHLYTDEQIAYPTNEDRRIAIVAGKLWATLAGMRILNRLTLVIANETSHYYMQAVDKSDTFRNAFSKLQDAILAEPTLSKAYVREKERLDLVVLPPLLFVNINLTKFGKIDRTLKKEVWPDPKSHLLVAHERFSQHLQTRLDNVTANDYENVLLAHLLEQVALEHHPLRKSAEKVFDKGVKEAVHKSYDMLKQNGSYTPFDRVLFATLNEVIKTHPLLDEKLTDMKSGYSHSV